MSLITVLFPHDTRSISINSIFSSWSIDLIPQIWLSLWGVSTKSSLIAPASENNNVIIIYSERPQSKTAKHSSRMRTTCLPTVSRGPFPWGGGMVPTPLDIPNPPEGHGIRDTHTPSCEQNDWQRPVKTFPSRNSNLRYMSLVLPCRHRRVRCLLCHFRPTLPHILQWCTRRYWPPVAHW